MLNAILGYIGIGGSAAELAGDVLNVVRSANDATDTELTREKRKQARKDFIANMINVGVPVAAGAAAGAASSPGGALAAIPAAQTAQSLVKSTGIGSLFGELFQPILAPIASILGFFKRKIRDHLKIDLGKWIGFGLNIAEPVVGVTKAATGVSTSMGNDPISGLLGIFSGLLSGGGQQSPISGLGKAFTGIIHGIAPLGNRSNMPKKAYMPSFHPSHAHTRRRNNRSL